MAKRQWTQLKGDTWYYNAPCNVGFCRGLVIEASDKKSGVGAAETMAENGLTPRWLFNTHGHADHFGGAQGFLDLGAELLATRKQTPFIEQPGLDTYYTFGAKIFERTYNPPEYIRAKRFGIEREVPEGEIELGGAHFTIEPHIGHAPDQVTVRTPDNVLFMGDILISEAGIDYFPAPVIYHLESYINDINYISQANADFYVPGHGPVLTNPLPVIEKNLALVDRILNLAVENCKEANSRENITAEVMKNLGLSAELGNFLLMNSTMGAFLAYLIDRGIVDTVPDAERMMLLYKRA